MRRLRRTISVVASMLWLTLSCASCQRPPQDLPVVVTTAADSRRLEWRDPYGPLLGEVPWVLRTDLLGPATYLVVETAAGDRCARSVSWQVLAAETTTYQVTLVSDLAGRVSWHVGTAGRTSMKLFTCRPRPADDPRQGCLKGGVPKPLLGELVGGISAELAGGGHVDNIPTVRFERAFPCGADAAAVTAQR